MVISKRKLLRIIITILAFGVGLYLYNANRKIEIQYVFFYSVLLLACFRCISSGIKESYIINPYLLFLTVPVSLLMYDLTVSPHYLVSLRPDTYSLAVYNIIMVLLGFFVGGNCKFRYSKTWKRSINQSQKLLSRNAIITLFLGLIPTMYGIIFGAQYLLNMDLNALKGLVNAAPLASIFNLFLYLSIMLALYSKNKKSIILCLAGLLVSLVLNFSKTTVVMLCICLLVYLYDITRVNFRIRKYFYISLILALGLVFISFTIYNNIRFDFDINTYFDDLGYIGSISQTWFLPIMYIISPWSNLQYIVDTTTAHSYGLWVLKPILGYLQIDGMWESVFELIPRYQAFNTYTYISVYYRDFGFIGSGICSFVLAIYIMYIYKMKLNYPNSPYISSIFALNMYATVMMFFNNHFQQLSYPFTIFIICWLFLKFTHTYHKGGV